MRPTGSTETDQKVEEEEETSERSRIGVQKNEKASKFEASVETGEHLPVQRACSSSFLVKDLYPSTGVRVARQADPRARARSLSPCLHREREKEIDGAPACGR